MIILNQAKFGQAPKGERLERIKKSPNYQNGEFKNLSETSVMTSDKSSFGTMMDFMFSKKVNVTPKSKILAIKTNVKEIDQAEDVLVWFGHSSYFIRKDGVTFLVDPVFSNYASPFSFVNKAFKGTDIYDSSDLPEIDYLIISHDHWDHLDYPTILELKSKVGQVICGLGVGQHFEYWGYEQSMIMELDWHDKEVLQEAVEITATPARHFSGRGLKRNKTLWTSYALKINEYNLYIGGDGGYDTFFTEIGEKYGPFDLAILEQGQYSENWNQIHLLPRQVFESAEQLRASRIFPVHNSKFALSSHPWDEPLDEIIENNVKNIPVMTPVIGEIVRLNDSTQTFSQWWQK
ncbi:MBL fold metallo-hydrolase [Flagellimonas zhangzhouensis]|nr:MBL fold metallo-hydrolase [Allomuricauda zhangzhouensis]